MDLTNDEIDAFKQKLSFGKTQAQSQLKVAEKLLGEYSTVQELLEMFPKKLQHNILVPLGPLAMMPGQLVNTNEYTVLLGENWFVDRTAIQTTDIMRRRQEYLKEQVDSLHKQLNSLIDTANSSDALFDFNQTPVDEEGNKIVDIREEYDLESETKKELSATPSTNIIPPFQPIEKSQSEIDEDNALLQFMNQLYLEEQNGLLDESEDSSEEESEADIDEEADYQEGRQYCGQEDFEPDLNESASMDEERVEEDEEDEEVEMVGDPHLKKQVTFSSSVVEPSNRKPTEFYSNPLLNMVMASNLDNQPCSIPDVANEAKPKVKKASRPAIVSDVVVETMPTSPINTESLDEAIDMQIVAEEYHRRRQERIMQQGGYNLTHEEREMQHYTQFTHDVEIPLQPNDPKPKKISRFKAARMADKEC